MFSTNALLLLVLCTITQGAVYVYYVRPINSSLCDGIEKCHTLEEYANDSTKYFGDGSEIHLLFFEGHHVADHLTITNNTAVRFVHAGDVSLTNSTQECDVFIECDITADLPASEVTLVLFQGICLQGGVAVMASGVSVVDCRFSAGERSSSGASPLTIYSRCSDINIVRSSFSGVSMNITLGQCNQTGTRNSVKIQDSVINGISIVKRTLISMILIEATVEIDNCTIKDGIGTGFYSQMNQSELSVTNSSVKNNGNGGVYVVTLSSGNNILVENTSITDNRLRDANNGNPYQWRVPNGAGLSICPHGDHINAQQSYSIVLSRIQVQNNWDKNDVPKIVFIYIPYYASIVDSQFLSNRGSAVAVYLTDHFTVTGNTEFINNSGYEGGALLMYTVYLTIANNSTVTFQGNHASNVGGAICVNNIPLQIDRSQRCFYQLQSPDSNVSLNFVSNTASKGGDHIYGATTKSPCSASTFGAHPNIFHFDPGFNETLSCVSSNPTRVCLCDESSQQQCADMDYIFRERKCYPGETLTVSAVVVGADFGAVAGSVFANIDENNSLTDLQYSQKVESMRCQELSYTVHAKEESETRVVLTKDYSLSNEWYQNETIAKLYVERYKQHGEVDINLLSIPVYVDITVNACPAGFKFVVEDKICVCDSRLQIDEKVRCYILGGERYITRTSTLWVSLEADSGIVRFNTKCPKLRCVDDVISLDMRTPDVQCRNNRTGTICGQCEKGHSLALGSLHCLICPANNIHLLLLIPFAVAGVLLVLFVKFLDLTVADGYVNGLIFYCNIVWVNKDILLPVNRVGTGFLRIFLAWFNLDLGIETCFFNGLDMYAYTWMQYIFIVYVLAISSLLVFIGRKVNLLGRNAPQVLATLLLLCYYKLLNNIVLSLRVATVTEIDTEGESSNTIVWEGDGSISYLNGKHILLFTVAVLLLMIICVPYTLLPLLLQQLNKNNHHTVRRLLLKLKPLTDAYSGPFKPRKEYWVGILLLVRVILLVISSVTYSTYSTFNNMALIVIVSALLVYKSQTGRVYRNRYLSLMENTLLLNLIVLAGIYYMSEYGHETFHDIVAFSLVALAFFQFFILVMSKVLLIIMEKCCNRRSMIEAAPLLEISQSFEAVDRSALGTTDVYLRWLDVERSHETHSPAERQS